MWNFIVCIFILGLCPDWDSWDGDGVRNAQEAMDLAEKYLNVPKVCIFTNINSRGSFARRFPTGSWAKITISHVVNFCKAIDAILPDGTSSDMNQSIIYFWFLNIHHLLIWLSSMLCISFEKFENFALNDWMFSWCVWVLLVGLDYCSRWNHKSARRRSVCDDLLVAVPKGQSLL